MNQCSVWDKQLDSLSDLVILFLVTITPRILVSSRLRSLLLLSLKPYSYLAPKRRGLTSEANRDAFQYLDGIPRSD